jgi:SMODS and SLOG-associating 2TM effector domain 1
MVDARTPNDPDFNIDHEQLDSSDVDVLYKIYMEMRLEAQSGFYESRIRENQLNADFTFTLGAAVMTLASLVATISATGNSPALSVLAAILPAFAALLASFRQLYGWERQTSIYRDALMGLERIKLMAPDNERLVKADLTDIYPQLVASGEAVFTGEVNQWGQFVQSAQQAEVEQETRDTRTTNALISDLRLSDEQIATIRAIVAAGTPKTAFSETITVHPEMASGALPASSAAPAAELPPFEATSAPPSYPDIPTPLRGHDTVPPPEAENSLSPGALHVDAPSTEDLSPPAPDEDPNLAG